MMRWMLMVGVWLSFMGQAYAQNHHDSGKTHEQGASTEVTAQPITLAGVISGAVCGVHGMVCTHKPDPEKHYELLGLYVDGKGFFFLLNVPQKVLRSVNREEVRVEGDLYPEMHAVYVRRLYHGTEKIFEQVQ